MQISYPPESDALAEEIADRDQLLDAALLGFSSYFDRADPPGQLTHAVMSQVACLRRAARGARAPEIRTLLAAVNGSPDLQAVLSSPGTQLDFLRNVHGAGETRVFRQQRGDIYAVQRGEAANDWELSDEALYGIAVAGSAVPVQFSTAPAAGVDGPGSFPGLSAARRPARDRF
jgi:hypothetical protein